jgi:hypothetical protein
MWIRGLMAFLFVHWFFVFSFGQREYPPCEAYESNEDDTIVAIQSYGNYLYAGIENILHVNKQKVGYPYELKTDNGDIFFYKGNYNIMPAFLGTATVFLHKKKGDTSIIMFQKSFFVKRLPRLKISMCDLIINKAIRIDKRYLLACDSIDVYYTDDLIGSGDWLEVIRFSIGYSYGAYYVDYTSMNNKMTQQMKEAIKNMRPGQNLNFHVTCINTDGVKVSVPKISVQVY